MPTRLDRDAVKRRLDDGDLRGLFIEDLGWDHGGADVEAAVAGRTFALEAVAHKRGMVAYRYAADSDAAFPDHPTRQKIEKAVTRSVREHLIVYAAPDGGAQYWQWVKREPGRPDRTRTHIHHRDQTGEALVQKLEQLVFTLEEEEDLTIVDVSGRVRAAFDFLQVLNFIPRIADAAARNRTPSELKILSFEDGARAKLALCCLNSNLFYWFTTIFSDCRNVNKREIDCFAIDLNDLLEQQGGELVVLADELMESLDRNSEDRKMSFKHDTLTVQCIFPKHSKPIIDEIDRALAAHYGFTDEELDFIINYDIKYRMGREGAARGRGD